MIRPILALTASASLLAACGTTMEQRVASGALGGAAGGYAVDRCKKSGGC